MKSDTIAAPATALSSAGIGIIRISGSESVEITDRIFQAKNGKKLADCASHTIHYGYIVDGGTLVDEVLVMLMKAPNSYTRKDFGISFTFWCKNGRTRRIYKACIFEWAD